MAELRPETARLLAELDALGVKPELRGGELRIQAPKGVLTPELQTRIKASRSELLAWLGQSAPAAPMAFSLFFFGAESAAAGYELLLEAAKIADQAGFAGFWTPERHFHDLGGMFPNPAVLAAALAPITTRIKLRAGSVVLPLQDPLRVAEEWAVVDRLSGGRVELSFASGWHANDFALAPANYSRRHEILYQRLAEVRALWRGEKLSRASGGEGPIAIGTYPRPLQAELPVWLTAIGNPESYRRIGEAGAHLLTALLDQSISELGAKLPIWRQALATAGHPPEAFRSAVFMHTYVGGDKEPNRELVREPLKAYLGQTLNLLGNLSRSLGLGLNPAEFDEADRQALLDFAFERYYAERSLMGDAAACRARIDELAAIGVQEIACLVDFGLPAQQVLAGIERLAELVRERQPVTGRSVQA